MNEMKSKILKLLFSMSSQSTRHVNKMVFVGIDTISPSIIRVEIFCSCSEKFCFGIECHNQSHSNRNDKIPSRSETLDLVSFQHRDGLHWKRTMKITQPANNRVTGYYHPRD